MEIDVYDFDGTIYDGDSSIDFYFFCLRKNKLLIIYAIYLLFSYPLYFIKIYNKKRIKEIFFRFIKNIDLDSYVKEFWKEKESKIKEFYMNKNHKNDIIVSASPSFLLTPICNKLKVKDLIASEVDKSTGRFISENCKGKEKVKRLYQKYPNAIVKNVYTDNYSDLPLISISNNAYLVKGDKIISYY